MTHILLQLFVYRRYPSGSPASRSAIGRMAGTTGILCNCFLSLIKLLAGLLTHSVSIIADAANNLSDAVSSVVTLVGFRLAQRPADEDHPFGHARYEYLSGLIVAELILLVGFELGKSSLQKILHPEPVPVTALTLVILLLSILTKLWMTVFYKKLGVMISSTTLEAASADSRNDCFATGAVLLCYLAGRFSPIPLDGYSGLAVAVFIFWSGIKLVQETISPLLGRQADSDLVHDLTDLVSSHDKILGVHDLLIHDYGPGQCFASLHAEMDANTDPLVSHDLLDHIESEALEDMNVHLVIHHDPVATDNAHWDALRQQAEQIAASIDPHFSIHDFRFVCCEDVPTMEFDLSVPYDCPMRDAQIVSQIRAALREAGVSSPVRIHPDRTNT